jgi:hypothetical protein
MMKAAIYSEILALTRSKQRHIPEDGILQGILGSEKGISPL